LRSQFVEGGDNRITRRNPKTYLWTVIISVALKALLRCGPSTSNLNKKASEEGMSCRGVDYLNTSLLPTTALFILHSAKYQTVSPFSHPDDLI
jgi:hypothetical protein